MLRALELLKKSKIVKYFEVFDFKQGSNFYFWKAKSIMTDGSELHIKEYVSENEYLYSFHWQDESGKLRIRWDNSPHHKKLRTFPHHKHIPEVEESDEIGLEDVLRVIEGMIL